MIIVDIAMIARAHENNFRVAKTDQHLWKKKKKLDLAEAKQSSKTLTKCTVSWAEIYFAGHVSLHTLD